jgi:7-cyano-7-deazaguanine reductase
MGIGEVAGKAWVAGVTFPAPQEASMALAEGRTLPFVSPEHVDVAVLETFAYSGPEQEIVTETDEFSAVCPYSGLPDFAKLTIRYVPTTKCIELKSLKYYVTSYRNVGIFQEHATAKLAEDLQRVLAARWLEVRTVYNLRGGFLTTCTVRLPTVK